MAMPVWMAMFGGVGSWGPRFKIKGQRLKIIGQRLKIIGYSIRAVVLTFDVRPWTSLDEMFAEGVLHQFCGFSDIKFIHNICAMPFHSADAEAKQVAYFPI